MTGNNYDGSTTTTWAVDFGNTTVAGNGPKSQGNFGQFQPHGTYTDFNTNPAYWGWNYVQGNTNAPNTNSSQWYREVISLGDAYPARGSGGYSMELAFPRNNAASAGVWMRTIENGTIGGWTRIDANGLSISGTNNYVAKFTGANSVGNSQIFDNGTNVGINRNNPAQKLDVLGRIRSSDPSYSTTRWIDIYSSSAQLIETTNDLYIGTTGASAIHLQPGRLGSSNGSVHIRNNAGTNWASFDGANQRLGIGTSTPTQKLHIVGGNILNEGILYQNTSLGQGSGAHGISWYQPSFVTWFDYMAPPGTTNAPSGTAAPTDATAGVTLWARRFNIEDVNGYGWIFESGANSTGTAPTAKFAISSNSGNFHSTGSGVVDGTLRAGAYAMLGTGITAGYYQDATNGAYRAIVGAGTTNGYYFQTNAGGTTTMYVGLGGTYNGKVGIGTTTPSFSLHVPSGYIGTDYINTTDNVVGSGVTGIMVKAGDNYHRTASAAAIATFLNATGTWIPNNGIGDWQIASSSTSTGYGAASLELRESNFSGASGIPPRLSLHWGGVVASQIGIESSGRIAILNNPGSSYESLIANNLYSQSSTYIGTYGGINSIPTTYGSIGLMQAKNGYYGILFGQATSNPNLMYDGSGNGGIYYENWGWLYYSLSSNKYTGFGTTSPAYKLHVVGDIYANGGWLRTSGNAGWYSESYGGGWYMSDDTWIRSYGSKSIYHDTGVMRTDGNFQVGISGSTLNVINGGNFAYRTNVLFANTTGNVGVGTASPAEKLHVVGNTRVSSLAGSGNRPVFADANGTLITSLTGISAGSATIVPIATFGGEVLINSTSWQTVTRTTYSSIAALFSGISVPAGTTRKYYLVIRKADNQPGGIGSYWRFSCDGAWNGGSDVAGHGFSLGSDWGSLSEGTTQWIEIPPTAVSGSGASTQYWKVDARMAIGGNSMRVMSISIAAIDVYNGSNTTYSAATAGTSSRPMMNMLYENIWASNVGGNVGIGTSSPSYKLDINGSMNCNDIIGQTFAGDKSIGTEPTVTWTTVRTITINKERSDTPVIINADFKGVTQGGYIVCAARIRRSGTTVGWNYGGAFNSGYSTGTSVVAFETGLAAGTYTYTLEYASTYSNHLGSTIVAFELKQ